MFVAITLLFLGAAYLMPAAEAKCALCLNPIGHTCNNCGPATAGCTGEHPGGQCSWFDQWTCCACQLGNVFIGDTDDGCKWELRARLTGHRVIPINKHRVLLISDTASPDEVDRVYSQLRHAYAGKKL